MNRDEMAWDVYCGQLSKDISMTEPDVKRRMDLAYLHADLFLKHSADYQPKVDPPAEPEKPAEPAKPAEESNEE